MIKIKNRIKEFKMVPAHLLIDNSKNFRKHPANQKNAMTELLETIGFVGAAVARQTDQGLVLIDGHMRKELSGEVPTLIVDLTDEEMDKVLATYDAVGDVALIDEKEFASLLEGIDLSNMPDVMSALDGLVSDDVLSESVKQEPQQPDGMELLPHEHYDYLVILARNTNDWNVLCERLSLVPKKRRGGVGTCRAIPADKVIARIKELADA